MSNNLRGGQKIWVAGDSVANSAASVPVYVGPNPYVAIYITNAHASVDCVFKLQVAGTYGAGAGRNEVGASGPDYGLLWCDYAVLKSDGTFAVLTFTSTHAVNLARDLSPFAPEWLRLLRTDTNGANVSITAIVTAFG